MMAGWRGLAHGSETQRIALAICDQRRHCDDCGYAHPTSHQSLLLGLAYDFSPAGSQRSRGLHQGGAARATCDSDGSNGDLTELENILKLATH